MTWTWPLILHWFVEIIKIDWLIDWWSSGSGRGSVTELKHVAASGKSNSTIVPFISVGRCYVLTLEVMTHDASRGNSQLSLWRSGSLWDVFLGANVKPLLIKALWVEPKSRLDFLTVRHLSCTQRLQRLKAVFVLTQLCSSLKPAEWWRSVWVWMSQNKNQQRQTDTNLIILTLTSLKLLWPAVNWNRLKWTLDVSLWLPNKIIQARRILLFNVWTHCVQQVTVSPFTADTKIHNGPNLREHDPHMIHRTRYGLSAGRGWTSGTQPWFLFFRHGQLQSMEKKVFTSIIKINAIFIPDTKRHPMENKIRAHWPSRVATADQDQARGEKLEIYQIKLIS